MLTSHDGSAQPYSLARLPSYSESNLSLNDVLFFIVGKFVLIPAQVRFLVINPCSRFLPLDCTPTRYHALLLLERGGGRKGGG